MPFLRNVDCSRPRVKELKSTIQKMGASTLLSAKSRKVHLVLALRKAQVAMRIVRHIKANRRKGAVLTIEVWWRRTRRRIPVNPRDPITLDEWKEVEHSQCFDLVTTEGAVQRYIADGLYQMIHSSGSPLEPLCRHAMNAVELQRLDRKVSRDLLGRYGPSRLLVGDDAKMAQQQRNSVREVVHYLQNALTSSCGVMDNVVNMARVVGPPNNMRLMVHLSSLQGEFISTFIQLCVVDLREARSYIHTTRKDYMLRLDRETSHVRTWLHSMMSLLDHCKTHSNDMANLGDFVVQVQTSDVRV